MPKINIHTTVLALIIVTNVAFLTVYYRRRNEDRRQSEIYYERRRHKEATKMVRPGTSQATGGGSMEYNPEVDRALEVKLIRTITDERGAFRIKFSPDGKLLAVLARRSQVVTIYNVATGAKVCRLEDLYERDNSVNAHDLSFCPSGKYLAICTLNPLNIIRIWDIGAKRVRNSFKAHLSSVLGLDFSPDGRLLVSGSADNTVRIWNMRDGASRIFRDSPWGIWSIRFSPDGRCIGAGTWQGEVLIWELRSGHLLSRWQGHTDVVFSIAFTPNGAGLISGSWDTTLKYWDLNDPILAEKIKSKRRRRAGDDTQKPSLDFVGHTNDIRSVSVSPDSRWVASGSDDSTTRIWDIGMAVEQCTLRGLTTRISVECSPTGHLLACSDQDRTVQIWSYKYV